jgi:uncharacterized peroxidase-related enzyme
VRWYAQRIRVYRRPQPIPEAMNQHLDLYMTLLFGKSGLSRAERELIAVVVSAANECGYCISHHAVALKNYWNELL